MNRIKSLAAILFTAWNLPLVAGDMEPMAAVQACLSTPGSSLAVMPGALLSSKAAETVPDMNVRILWDEKGHLYTTALLAQYAKLNAPQILALSYYSQYPDIDSDYGAVSVSLKYLALPNKWPWRSDITGVLHSLHGGDYEAIVVRRKKINDVLAESFNDPTRPWLPGLVIHAYGDAFAHTSGDFGTPAEHAYNPWIGHMLPSLFGQSPDEVKDQRRKEKYLAYTKALYAALPKDNPDSSGFEAYVNRIAALDCSIQQCPTFHPPEESPSKEPSELEILMNTLRKCMSDKARSLSKTEVQYAIDLIE